MPGKKLGNLVGVIALGSFFAVQAMFGFPIKDLIRNEVTEESKVVIKDQQGTCILEHQITSRVLFQIVLIMQEIH